jgi:hypothetical protein
VTGIFDDPRNARADELMHDADCAVRRGESEAALELYAQAAALETAMAEQIPASMPRTLAAYAVTAAVLWKLAGNRAKALETAQRFLDKPYALGGNAIDQLHEVVAWAEAGQ